MKQTEYQNTIQWIIIFKEDLGSEQIQVPFPDFRCAPGVAPMEELHAEMADRNSESNIIPLLLDKIPLKSAQMIFTFLLNKI